MKTIVLIVTMVVFSKTFTYADEFKCDHRNWESFISKVRGLQRASSCTSSMSFAECKEFLGLGVVGRVRAIGRDAASKVAKRIRDKNFRVCSVQNGPSGFERKISFAYHGMLNSAYASECFPRQQVYYHLLRSSQSEVEKLLSETASAQKQALAIKTAELAEMQTSGPKAVQLAQERLKFAEAKAAESDAKVALLRQKSGYEAARLELEASRSSAVLAEGRFSQDLYNMVGIRLNQTGAIPVSRLEENIDGSNLSDSAKARLKKSLSQWTDQELKSDKIQLKVRSLENSDEYKQLLDNSKSARSEIESAKKSIIEAAERQKNPRPVDPEKIKAITEDISKLKNLSSALDERVSAVKTLFEHIVHHNNLKPNELAAAHEALRALVPEIQDHVNFSKISNLRHFSSMLVQDKIVKDSISRFLVRADEGILRSASSSSSLAGFFARFPTQRVVSIGSKVATFAKYATAGVAAAALAPAAFAQEVILNTGNGGCQGLNSTTFPVSPEGGCKLNLSLTDQRVNSLVNLPDEQLCEKLKSDPNLLNPISTFYSQAYPPLRASCGPPITLKSPSSDLFDGDVIWSGERIVIKSNSGKPSEQSVAISMSGETERAYDISLLNLNRGRSGSGSSHKKTAGSWPPSDVNSREVSWIQKYSAIKPALIEVSSCCSKEGVTPSNEDCQNYGLNPDSRNQVKPEVDIFR